MPLSTQLITFFIKEFTESDPHHPFILIVKFPDGRLKLLSLNVVEKEDPEKTGVLSP
jgi:hypothetical protein